MPEEVSPESKLYVKEEIEKTRKEIKEEVEKVNSRATKTFTTVALVIGIITGLGVYGSAKHYISATIQDKLGTETLKEFEKNKITAGQNMIESERLIAEAKSLIAEANDNLNEIIQLKKIAYLPIGTILPSMLDPNTFAKAVGDPPVFDPVKSKWALADKREVTDANYGKFIGNITPDLRGMFLRGMNVNNGQDPDQNRIAGHPQQDALQDHGHETDARKHGWGELGKQGYTKQGGEAPRASVTTVTGANAAVETRPKNVAVYFYIKIN
ncbi:MAG: hypothetical protein ACYS9C_18355 [Planctomycetota bacterium]|jgi:hypothetical protein